MGKTWVIASGNGGVGKTTLALLLALGAARKGKRTILIDASGTARSCDLVLGLEGVMSIDLSDALIQQMDLNAGLYAVPHCDHLRIANASFYENTELSELSGLLLALQSMCDILVVDLPTGKMFTDTGMLTEQDEIIFVARPDDASIRSTEMLLQNTRCLKAGYSLVLNRVKREKIKKGTQYASEAAAMVLDCPLLGVVAEDDGYMAELVSRNAIRSLIPWKSNPINGMLEQLLNR